MPAKSVVSILSTRIASILVISILCFVVTIAFSSPAASQEVDIDGELKNRLMSGMKALEALSKKTSGRGSFVFKTHNAAIQLTDGRFRPESRTEEVYEISVLGDAFLKEASNERGVETLKVVNSEYAFVLTRPKGGIFSIAGLGKRGASRSDDVRLEGTMGSSRNLFFAAYHFHGRPVWDLIRDSGFKLIGIKTSDGEEGERFHVEFSYTPQQVTNIDFMDVVVEAGYLVFVPHENWRLSEYCRGVYPVFIETMDNPPTDQLAFTKSSAETRNEEDGSFGSGLSTTGTELSYEPVPKEEFYLSFYGFPEPEFGGTNYWTWIIACGVLGGGCLIAARHLLKRQSQW